MSLDFIADHIRPQFAVSMDNENSIRDSPDTEDQL